MEQHVVGHEHCGVCGSCLLNAAQLHVCNINKLRGDIKDVYEELTKPHKDEA